MSRRAQDECINDVCTVLGSIITSIPPRRQSDAKRRRVCRAVAHDIVGISSRHICSSIPQIWQPARDNVSVLTHHMGVDSGLLSAACMQRLGLISPGVRGAHSSCNRRGDEGRESRIGNRETEKVDVERVRASFAPTIIGGAPAGQGT